MKSERDQQFDKKEKIDITVDTIEDPFWRQWLQWLKEKKAPAQHYLAKKKQSVRYFLREIDLKKIKYQLKTFMFRLFKKRKTRSKRKYRVRKSKKLRKRIRLFKFIRFLSFSILFFSISGVLAFFVLFAYFARELPQVGKVRRSGGYSSKIYDRDGVLLYDLYDTQRRDPATPDQVPDILKKAVVAIEDKEFYNHTGYDLVTILRLPYYYFVKKRVIGGSTITQQLVKNALLTNDRTISRKYKEIILAIQIDRTYNKDEILTMYLNEVPYGGTVYGVATAANVYFDKSVSELNLLESAVLAGLPQSPSKYSPFLGQTNSRGEFYWKIRTKGVLRRMKEDGYISSEEHKQALADLETLTIERQPTEIKAAHFVFYVKRQLIDMFGENVVEQGGLQVKTTLDYDHQRAAEVIVYDEIEELKKHDVTNGSVMIMDPQSGEIIAMVGSKNYFDSEINGQFNIAVDGLRQPGSSIKPVTYLAMIRRGYTPAHMLVDVRTNFKPNEDAPDYKPRNYNGVYHGPVSLRECLGNSLNVPAVKSLAIIGVENFLQQAYEMGFKTLKPTEDNLKRFGLAVTLGGAEVHLIDSVTAYSSFANGGKKIEPVSILEVKNQNGQLLYQYKPSTGQRIFDEGEAFLINDILSDNGARTMAFGAYSVLATGQPIAVKTGTTNSMRDNWTIGWSQDFIVGSWVGNSDNSPMGRVVSGVSGASPIWRKVVDHLLENGYEAKEWEKPDNVEEVEVDAVSGYPAHDDFPSKIEYVIKGTEPRLPDPIHTKLKVCESDNDKLATAARIARGKWDEREFIILNEEDPISTDGKNRWQAAIDAWIDGESDERYDVPTEYCGDEGDVYIRFKEPDDETTFEEEEIEVRIKAYSDDGIEKIELWIDGELREVVNHYEYEGKVHLEKGRHVLRAKAETREGETTESSKVVIGTGGADWEEPEEEEKKVEDEDKDSQPTLTPTPKQESEED